MGTPISYDERVKIVERVKQGDSYASIAKDLCRSVVGVKKIWYAFKKEGCSAFHTKHTNCGRKSEYGSQIRKELSDLRDNQQGSYYIYSKFKAKYPEKKAPHPSTLNRWWRELDTTRVKGRPTNSEKKVGVKQPIKSGK